MTAPITLARTPELTPLADYLAGVLTRLRSLPPLDLDLTYSHGRVLAADVCAPSGLPAFDHATVDGYAARLEDLVGAAPHHPIRLTVAGDVNASTVRATGLAAGTCVAVAAGAPLPAAADVVVPPGSTDQGMAAIEIRERPKRGHGVRRTGAEVRAGSVLAGAGTRLTPGMVALLAATGVARVLVRPHPRVAVISTGDELVDAGRPSEPGRVVDANSHALAAAAADAGGHPYRIGACPDDPDALRGLLADQDGRADLIVISGGTGSGPGDVVRRSLGRDGTVAFTAVSLFPCTSLGFGLLGSSVIGSGVLGSGASGSDVLGSGRLGAPVICLPGDPGAALVGFEVLARPVIQALAGARPFRPSVRAHLLETLASPLGLREFRPARVSERRGGGYTARPLAGGPYTLSGMAQANGIIVLGERIGHVAAGSMVDVLLLDRRQ